MTVSSSTSRVKYSCNGSVTEFAFTFGVGATSEIQVIYTDTTGSETVLTETTNYAVSATNNDFESGGKVTTVSTYATGTYITILRNVPLTQASDFTENRATLYETFEDGLDKNIRIAQQQKEELNRIPKLAKSSAYAGNTYTFPDPSPSRVIGWNSGATDLTTYLVNGSSLDISNIVSIGDYSNNIATAISSIGSAETTLCINASTSGNATIPTNVQLWFVKGGQLTGTVAFSGSPDSQIKALPGQQIFSTTSTITFGIAGTLSAKWWPATGDGITDDTAAFDKVIACAIASGSSIYIPAGIYLIDDFILNNGLANGSNKYGQEIYGDGTNITILKATGNSAKFLQFTGSAGVYFYTYFKAHDFTIDMTNMPNAATSMGIYGLYAYGGTVENVNVINQPASAYALYLDQHCYTTVWDNCDFGGLTGVINLTGVGAGSVTTQTFIGCSFAKAIIYDVSAISFVQPIIQGDLTPKFDLEEVYGMSVIGGDIEGTGTLYDFGANTNQFVSQNNALVGFTGTYSTGTMASGMLLDQIYPVTATGNPFSVKNQAITSGAVASGYVTAMDINGVVKESVAYSGATRKLIENSSGVANLVDIEFKNLGGSTLVGRGAADETYLAGTASKKVMLMQGSSDKLGVTASDTVFVGTATQAGVGAAGAATALPAQPAGYIRVQFTIGGTVYVIPYYAGS